MDIQIEEITITSKREGKRTPADQKAIERYQAAHKKVYGIPVHIEKRNGWLYVQGQKQGVSANRLKEMARQLEFRDG